jgi:hypothetical protein
MILKAKISAGGEASQSVLSPTIGKSTAIIIASGHAYAQTIKLYHRRKLWRISLWALILEGLLRTVF